MSREGSTFSSSVSILSCERVFAHKARDIRPARQFSSAFEAPRGRSNFYPPDNGLSYTGPPPPPIRRTILATITLLPVATSLAQPCIPGHNNLYSIQNRFQTARLSILINSAPIRCPLPVSIQEIRVILKCVKCPLRIRPIQVFGFAASFLLSGCDIRQLLFLSAQIFKASAHRRL